MSLVNSNSRLRGCKLMALSVLVASLVAQAGLLGKVSAHDNPPVPARDGANSLPAFGTPDATLLPLPTRPVPTRPMTAEPVTARPEVATRPTAVSPVTTESATTRMAPPEIYIDVPQMAPGHETGIHAWLEPSQATSTLRTVGLLSIISLAPAIALMTTSYIRVTIVLTLLRQGLGAQGLPSNQMISALALFISAVIMRPVWTEVYNEAIVPYSDPNTGMSLEDAFAVGAEPVRKFMSRQIYALGNQEDIWLFCRYLPEGTALTKDDDVPLTALIPAFMLSELKTAFLLGFQIYLPFLVLDILVASVTVSMGMFMVPPAYVSLPFKLLLFVMVDGWHLLVDMLLKSFVT